MRTGYFLIAGFLLMGGALILGRLFGPLQAGALHGFAIAFVVVWCLVSAANLWFGVATVGYSFKEELPVFLLIFGVPSIALGGVLRYWNVL